MTFVDVNSFLAGLGGVERGVWWRNPTWQVGNRQVAWQRPLSARDRARLEGAGARIPTGEILAVQLDSLDEKDAVLSLGLPGFFTIAHFDGFPAVLVELRLARARDVREALRRSWERARSRGPRSPKRAARQAPSGRLRSRR